ncbi:MAG: Pyruvate/2-oxoglutarate dehydrogenase [Acidobacteria bacterium]|nr:Pyruvate/2-oxoglutarate dehydrogenase [Acidobacteriota bacterium]
MPTPIVMPQMGESIAEGTIVRWMKKVGDRVDRDEPLFEITTDKVDAEIPSPAAGILTEITAKEGDTVSVNTVVGTIQLAGEEPGQEATPRTASAQQVQTGPSAVAPAAETTATARVAHAASGQATGEVPRDGLRRQTSSPLVRRIAREHNVDVARITGSGLGGRVTKQDILEYVGRDSGSGVRDSMKPLEAGVASPASRAPSLESRIPRPGLGNRVEIQPLSAMRKKIAEHMVLSQRTSAHVHSVFHVDFSDVQRIRQEKKDEYERLGAKLSYMAFIAMAVIDALRRHPIVNASLDGDNVVYRKDINLGIAVALESGLIVPVVRNADEKNLLGLSRAIADVAERARARQLKPEEVHGGTFTITNPGQFGAQFGMPIINQPQVAILGVGTIEKRPVVVDDSMAIRMMAYLTLGFDHRLIDGAVADQFMADVKKHLEHFDVKNA